MKCDARFRHAGITLTLVSSVSLQTRIYGGPQGRNQQRFAPLVPGLSYPVSLAIWPHGEAGAAQFGQQDCRKAAGVSAGPGIADLLFHSWALEQGCRGGQYEDQRGVSGGCPKGCVRDYSSAHG